MGNLLSCNNLIHHKSWLMWLITIVNKCLETQIKILLSDIWFCTLGSIRSNWSLKSIFAQSGEFLHVCAENCFKRQCNRKWKGGTENNICIFYISKYLILLKTLKSGSLGSTIILSFRDQLNLSLFDKFPMQI